MSKTIILNHTDIAHKIRRIAYQIYEVNAKEKEVIIAGIDENGYILAKKIEKVLNTIATIETKLCRVVINKKAPLTPVTTSLDADDYTAKSVVLIDDVLNGGATLMYAVRHFLAVPLKQLKTVVMVDRNHKKYPIKVDFKGLSLSTSLQNHIEMNFSATGDEAYLI